MKTKIDNHKINNQSNTRIFVWNYDKFEKEKVKKDSIGRKKLDEI